MRSFFFTMRLNVLYVAFFRLSLYLGLFHASVKASMYSLISFFSMLVASNMVFTSSRNLIGSSENCLIGFNWADAFCAKNAAAKSRKTYLNFLIVYLCGFNKMQHCPLIAHFFVFER